MSDLLLSRIEESGRVFDLLESPMRIIEYLDRSYLLHLRQYGIADEPCLRMGFYEALGRVVLEQLVENQHVWNIAANYIEEVQSIAAVEIQDRIKKNFWAAMTDRDQLAVK